MFAAACIFDDKFTSFFSDLRDSKKLSEKKRNEIFLRILRFKIPFGVGTASVDEIDNLNILQASLLAMRRAVHNLPSKPSLLLIDGNQKIDCKIEQFTIVGGDAKEKSISAASVIAKVLRDRLLFKYDSLYPGYGFSKHKGYGTNFHISMIKKWGVLSIHRRTFKGVREFIT